jgi:UDP-2,4-diacetamido-2,4,6-trideoxy-beta-L-altropyranose hydrolase
MKTVFRADASAKIGTGHVMRCLALSQQWQHNGGRIVFAHAEITPTLAHQLSANGAEVVTLSAAPGSPEDADQTAAHARQCGANWIVADGYVFGTIWQKQIKDAGFRLLVIDDYGHAEHYHADIILNQNASAQEQLYTRRDSTTRLLLGTRYTLLRREFFAWRDWRREISDRATKILVTVGGSDPDNVTGTVIEALAQLSGIETVVVVGGSNPNLEILQKLIGPQNPSVRLAVNAANMPELMAWADVAISAAGSTAWELAYMGLPSVLIVTADNQANAAAALHREGICLNLVSDHTLTARGITDVVRSLLADSKLRQHMSQKARQLVDGEGAARVITRLLAAQIHLRPVAENDRALLWEWANDPEVRALSFHSEKIPWETHIRWFQERLHDTDDVFFLGSYAGGEPLGQVRFDRDTAGRIRVHASVDRRQRAAGLGAALILRAVDELFATTPITAVHAFIKAENHPSIRAFQKAGFTPAESRPAHGQPILHLCFTAS